MNIGNNIKKYRELKNITRETMAAELGLSTSGYSKIERNEVDLTLSRVQQIAQIIGVDPSQILNVDASQIFNVSNNHFIQGLLGAKAETMNLQPDNYREKYIKMLEAEVTRLKKIVGEK